MNQLQMLKMALISYVTNSAKAIWSTIAHPLAIVGSKKCNLKDYKIYGGGKNLLNVNKVYPAYVNDEGGITYTNSNMAKIHKENMLKEYKDGVQYTVSMNYVVEGDTGNSVSIVITYTDGAYTRKYIGVNTSGSLSISSIQGKTVSTIIIGYSSGSVLCNVKLTNMQIEEGATATEYEPYQYTDNFPVTVRGKNLFNIDGEREILKGSLPNDSYKVENGVMSFKTGFYVISSTAFGIKVQVKKNTGYRLNYKLLAGRPVIRVWSSNGTQVTSTNTPDRNFNSGDNEVLYFGFASNAWDDYTELTDIIIVEDSSADKTYEPYIEPQTIDIFLDEPLGAGEVIQQSVDGLPNLPQFKGTTIYEVQTDTPPSGIEVCYYG